MVETIGNFEAVSRREREAPSAHRVNQGVP